jgi:hypothetical protein
MPAWQEAISKEGDGHFLKQPDFLPFEPLVNVFHTGKDEFSLLCIYGVSKARL